MSRGPRGSRWPEEHSPPAKPSPSPRVKACQFQAGVRPSANYIQLLELGHFSSLPSQSLSKACPSKDQLWQIK